MKTFRQWLKENYNEEIVTTLLDGEWFAERGLPMIVECTCCSTTMALPSAMIDDDDYIYCSNCCE